MKIFYNQKYDSSQLMEEDFSPVNLRESIEKTRLALDLAYAGFDNALDTDLIDSYIYEINSLQKRYKHLINLAGSSSEAPSERTFPEKSYQHSPIRALVSHVFG